MFEEIREILMEALADEEARKKEKKERQRRAQALKAAHAFAIYHPIRKRKMRK